MLSLYAIFHLNLAFSSIEEDLRPEVIRTCYWPLLQLARDLKLPFGIEASAYTLEVIESIDPSWLEELRLLCSNQCEFIASGYSQLIGPLVPAEVNEANLRVGQAVYRRLGLSPEIALINEQAYAAGLLEHYMKAGFKAIVMEWDNPASDHHDWDREWGYFPQYASDGHGHEIPLIWNRAIVFQKFQRYAHGEQDLTGYLAYLQSHNAAYQRFLPVYGNDVEIFDFRPGRFQTEAMLGKESEWERIKKLFMAIKTEPDLAMIKPGALLQHLDVPHAGNRLQLESACQPIPVKKQPKYNISRWALTGRDDLRINTQCWRAYQMLKGNDVDDDRLWQELCYLWSSDFRTHITENRWQAYLQRLQRFNQSLEQLPGNTAGNQQIMDCCDSDSASVCNEKVLIFENNARSIHINTAKGLTIDNFANNELSCVPLIKTIEHGFYDHIEFGADFYSGHLVFESPGQHKVTDLATAPCTIQSGNEGICVCARYATSLGEVVKEMRISPSVDELQITYTFSWPKTPIGSLRLGNITLNPEAFDSKSLFVSTHNGGYTPDFFRLEAQPVNHLLPVSSLVSSRQGLGVTAGEVIVGDATKCLVIAFDKSKSAAIAQIQYVPFKSGSYFLRIIFSLQEYDDTSKASTDKKTFAERQARMCINSRPTEQTFLHTVK